ncbi:MAG TPA: hypothetical protein PKW55_02970 [Spirochaetota bacterium]|nr:hypothetical protein [Spirochaetota bacterium]HOM38188.1 hypothetical protein [Spirochaetota bacterium]HPQ48594.1 hypothetical protein [Spirochaetota bacterium]
MKKLLVVTLMLFLVGTVFSQEDKNLEEMKTFLKEKLKVKNDGEIEKCMIRVRERVKASNGEKINYELLKESIKISYSNGLDLETAADFAFEVQNQTREMEKYGFSELEAKNYCVKVQNNIVTQEKNNIKKSISNPELKEKLMLTIRTRLQEKIKEKIKEKESSTTGKKTQQKAKVQKVK